MPVLQEFNPDLVLVSCGFDSAAGDPIGGLRVTSDGFVFMTQQLVGLKRPISFVLEGGYDLSILEWGSCAVIKGLVEKPSEKTISGCNKIGQEGIELCMKAISPYWKCLKS
jgi:histone deacetylase 6